MSTPTPAGPAPQSTGPAPHSTRPADPLASLPVRVDLAAVLVLTLVALVGLRTTYGGVTFLVVGALGAALGTTIAVLARRLPVAVLVPGVTVAAIGFSGVVLPDTAVAAVVPTPSGALALLRAGIQGWPALLDVVPPVGTAYDLVALPFVSAILVTAVAVSAAVRQRRLWWPLALPPVVLLALTILFGTRDPALPLAQGAGLAVALVGWRALRSRLSRTVRSAPMNRHSRPTGALVVAVALAAGVFAGPVLPGTAADRFVLRDRSVPPFDPKAFASPLGRVRKDLTANKDAVLFTVAGLPAGARMRVATLDTYDGAVFAVAGEAAPSETSSGWFQKVGSTVDDGGARGDRVTITVQIRGYTGIWLPDAGALRSLTFTGPRRDDLTAAFRYNLATGTAAAPLGVGDDAGLRDGDGYTAEVVLAPETGLDELSGAPGAAELPAPQQVPQAVANQVNRILASGGGDPLEPVRTLAKTYREGYYSSGQAELEQKPSVPGHGSARLEVFADPQAWMLGDEEQYAAAATLVLRTMDLPARVVVGYRPPAPTSAGSAVEVRGEHASAWPEVLVDGQGWVPVDVTPPRSRTQTPDQPPSNSGPGTRTPGKEVQAPFDPSSSSFGKTTDPFGGRPRPKPQPDGSAGAWLAVAGAAVGGLALLASPFLLIVARKALRRRRRRRSGDPSTAVAGSWWEVLDIAADLGRPVPPTATRRQAALLLASPSATELALRTDELVFGGAPIEPEEVADVWTRTVAVRRDLLGQADRRRRWRARVSPTSLRWRIGGSR